MLWMSWHNFWPCLSKASCGDSWKMVQEASLKSLPHLYAPKPNWALEYFRTLAPQCSVWLQGIPWPDFCHTNHLAKGLTKVMNRDPRIQMIRTLLFHSSWFHWRTYMRMTVQINLWRLEDGTSKYSPASFSFSFSLHEFDYTNRATVIANTYLEYSTSFSRMKFLPYWCSHISKVPFISSCKQSRTYLLPLRYHTVVVFFVTLNGSDVVPLFCAVSHPC